jgi:adenosylcobinamide-phosphate synthase
MHHFSNVELALAALLLEAAVGYPSFVYRAIGHPVTWMGALLTYLEHQLNRSHPTGQTPPASGRPDRQRRLPGVLALILLLTGTTAVAIALDRLFSLRPIGAGLSILMATSFIAQRSLYQHVRAVADALQRDGLQASRKAVSQIVGRNPARLDEAGVARAAIESLAENFSDGIVAPAFWMAVTGLPGAALYKAVNTADSMIGHRTPRYVAFGWAAARLDDMINLPASRLAAAYLIIGALCIGGSPRQAASAVRRDARRHRSPNAGWPEAAMAGALGLRLAGPRVYGEEIVPDAFMGNGRAEATVADIRRALRLFQAACVIQWLVLLTIVLIVRA